MALDKQKKSPKVLLLAPFYEGQASGESLSNYEWIRGMSERFDTTILTLKSPNQDFATSPTNAQSLVSWDDIQLPKKFQRLSWELKPGYFKFYAKARSWIRQQQQAGNHFDLAHQVGPLALRYPCPAAGLNIPYLIDFAASINCASNTTLN